MSHIFDKPTDIAVHPGVGQVYFLICLKIEINTIRTTFLKQKRSMQGLILHIFDRVKFYSFICCLDRRPLN
ncbi:unnamed protein product [Tenebrio molitor]|nr:unnamed protein product [Tenebrio molitor]